VKRCFGEVGTCKVYLIERCFMKDSPLEVRPEKLVPVRSASLKSASEKTSKLRYIPLRVALERSAFSKCPPSFRCLTRSNKDP
jgi:hypothetical protein